MRFFHSFLLCGLLIGCQSNHFYSDKKADFVSPVSNVHHFVLQQEELKQMKTAKYRTTEYKVKLELLSQHQFIFLEDAMLEESEVDALPNITADFKNVSTAVIVYDLSKHDYAAKYSEFMGRTISVYDFNRVKSQLKIQRLVLIADPAFEKPYVALAVENTDQSLFYHGFATSDKRMNPFPFIEIENPEIAQTSLAYFDSLSEYHRLKNEIENNQIEIESEDLEVRIFEWKKNDRFVFVQHRFNENCDQLYTSYAALYHVTRDNWIQECEGVLEYNFLDLMDSDDDNYPELLMAQPGVTAIIEINDSGFSVKKKIIWAEAECAC
jgi:hypothetical protein